MYKTRINLKVQVICYSKCVIVDNIITTEYTDYTLILPLRKLCIDNIKNLQTLLNTVNFVYNYL
jgi:hypothetical protein